MSYYVRVSVTSLELIEDLKSMATAGAPGKYAKFVAQTKAALKEMLSSGTGFDVNEVHDYLRRRTDAAQPGYKKDSFVVTAPKPTSWRVR